MSEEQSPQTETDSDVVTLVMLGDDDDGTLGDDTNLDDVNQPLDNDEPEKATRPQQPDQKEKHKSSALGPATAGDGGNDNDDDWSDVEKEGDGDESDDDATSYDAVVSTTDELLPVLGAGMQRAAVGCACSWCSRAAVLASLARSVYAWVPVDRSSRPQRPKPQSPPDTKVASSSTTTTTTTTTTTRGCGTPEGFVPSNDEGGCRRARVVVEDTPSTSAERTTSGRPPISETKQTHLAFALDVAQNAVGTAMGIMRGCRDSTTRECADTCDRIVEEAMEFLRAVRTVCPASTGDAPIAAAVRKYVDTRMSVQPERSMPRPLRPLGYAAARILHVACNQADRAAWPPDAVVDDVRGRMDALVAAFNGTWSRRTLHARQAADLLASELGALAAAGLCSGSSETALAVLAVLHAASAMADASGAADADAASVLTLASSAALCPWLCDRYAWGLAAPRSDPARWASCSGSWRTIADPALDREARDAGLLDSEGASTSDGRRLPRANLWWSTEETTGAMPNPAAWFSRSAPSITRGARSLSSLTDRPPGAEADSSRTVVVAACDHLAGCISRAEKLHGRRGAIAAATSVASALARGLDGIAEVSVGRAARLCGGHHSDHGPWRVRADRDRESSDEDEDGDDDDDGGDESTDGVEGEDDDDDDGVPVLYTALTASVCRLAVAVCAALSAPNPPTPSMANPCPTTSTSVASTESTPDGRGRRIPTAWGQGNIAPPVPRELDWWGFRATLCSPQVAPFAWWSCETLSRQAPQRRPDFHTRAAAYVAATVVSEAASLARACHQQEALPPSADTEATTAVRALADKMAALAAALAVYEVATGDLTVARTWGVLGDASVAPAVDTLSIPVPNRELYVRERSHTWIAARAAIECASHCAAVADEDGYVGRFVARLLGTAGGSRGCGFVGLEALCERSASVAGPLREAFLRSAVAWIAEEVGYATVAPVIGVPHDIAATLSLTAPTGALAQPPPSTSSRRRGADPGRPPRQTTGTTTGALVGAMMRFGRAALAAVARRDADKESDDAEAPPDEQEAAIAARRVAAAATRNVCGRLCVGGHARRRSPDAAMDAAFPRPSWSGAARVWIVDQQATAEVAQFAVAVPESFLPQPCGERQQHESRLLCNLAGDALWITTALAVVCRSLVARAAAGGSGGIAASLDTAKAFAQAPGGTLQDERTGSRMRALSQVALATAAAWPSAGARVIDADRAWTRLWIRQTSSDAPASVFLGRREAEWFTEQALAVARRMAAGSRASCSTSSSATERDLVAHRCEVVSAACAAACETGSPRSLGDAVRVYGPPAPGPRPLFARLDEFANLTVAACVRALLALRSAILGERDAAATSATPSDERRDDDAGAGVAGSVSDVVNLLRYLVTAKEEDTDSAVAFAKLRRPVVLACMCIGYVLEAVTLPEAERQSRRPTSVSQLEEGDTPDTDISAVGTSLVSDMVNSLRELVNYTRKDGKCLWLPTEAIAAYTALCSVPFETKSVIAAGTALSRRAKAHRFADPVLRGLADLAADVLQSVQNPPPDVAAAIANIREWQRNIGIQR
jgi:hypothetical protein